MRRLLPLAVALALAGCDAGNRADPGSDNTFQSPTLIVSTPSEGQQVVPAANDGVVRVLFDLQGATLGRGAGSKVRYRLQREVERPRTGIAFLLRLVEDPTTHVASPDAAGLRLLEDKEADDKAVEKALEPLQTPWILVADPQRAVSLGKLAPVTNLDAQHPYVLTAEVLDKDGQPWTREEEGKGTVNARARVVRRFTVHTSWKGARGS
jgi:hypothetical protein